MQSEGEKEWEREICRIVDIIAMTKLTLYNHYSSANEEVFGLVDKINLLTST